MHYLLAIKLQNESKSLKANNGCSNFCEITSKQFSFRFFVSDVIHKNLKLKCFGGHLT